MKVYFFDNPIILEYNKGDSKMNKIISMDEIVLNTRRTWGSVNPCQRTFKSKKAYSRKDKSWKKAED